MDPYQQHHQQQQQQYAQCQPQQYLPSTLNAHHHQMQQSSSSSSASANTAPSTAPSSTSTSTSTTTIGHKRKASHGAAAGDNNGGAARPTAKASGSKKSASSANGGAGAGASSGNTTASGSVAPPLPRGSACQVCRKRKLRCDGTRPVCGSCNRLGHACVYGDPIHEKLQEKIRNLEAKVETLESELDGYHAQELERLKHIGGSGGDEYEAKPYESGHDSQELPLPLPPPPLVIPESASQQARAHVRMPSAPSVGTGTPSSTYAQAFPSPSPRHHTLGGGGGYAQLTSLSPHVNQQQQHPMHSPPISHSNTQPQYTPAESHAFPMPPPQPTHLQQQQQQQQHNMYAHPPPPPPPVGHQPFHQQQQQHQHQFPHPQHAYSSPSSAHAIPAPAPAPSSANGQHAAHQAHLQAFPFMMQHPHSAPQLADLINSPASVGGGPILGPGSGGSNTSPGTGVGGGGDNGLGWMPNPTTTPSPAGAWQQQQQQQQPYGVNGSGMGHTHGGLTTTWGGNLPSLDVLLDLANIYFNTVHIHYPFLQRHRFLYSLNNPTSLTSPPSLSLIYAVLATAAPYSDSPTLRHNASDYYLLARSQVETAINVGAHGRGGRTVASLTVETVQALCLLTMIETAASDHQRAFLSLGQAVRIAAMLGLHRMDEDRVEDMLGLGKGARRLRPPALHALPTDPLLLEECRRTMCTVFILDRFESASVGWPPAIAEVDIRVLLPCEDRLYDLGVCALGDNPLWWPPSDLGSNGATGGGEVQAQTPSSAGGFASSDAGGPSGGAGSGSASGGNVADIDVDSFAWLVRVVWLGGRIQTETYRSSGRPAEGPWHTGLVAPVDDVHRVLDMDRCLEQMRNQIMQRAMRTTTTEKQPPGAMNVAGANAPLAMSLLVLNCNFINLHHLRVGLGLQSLPFNPHAPCVLGSAEFSMQRCLEALRSLRDLCAQLAMYENARTTLYNSRQTVFTSFVPHVLYAIVFPCKFAIGDWNVIAASRIRAENVPARVPTSSSMPHMPSGDDVFGPARDDERLALIDILCDAVDRMAVVWPIGRKFSAMLKGDRVRLAARIMERRSPAPGSVGSSSF